MSAVAPCGDPDRGRRRTGAGLERYTFVERIVHWTVAITFIALHAVGLRPRATPGCPCCPACSAAGRRCGSSTPGSVSGFTVGIVVMLVMWARPMRIDAGDRGG